MPTVVFGSKFGRYGYRDRTRAAAVPLTIDVAGRAITARIKAKTLRKAQRVIGANTAENVAVLLQGKLGPGDELLEAGVTVQIREKHNG